MNRRRGSLVRQQGRQTQELEQQDSFISQTDSTNNQSALTTRLESALQHLQPIRDLAQNWDVDIASCLEDVLNELAAEHQFSQQQWATDESAFSQSFHSQQSQQHHHATIAAHFSQAAILLQNAGFVYSRKVEYLYNLVFQAMKDLSNSNLSDNSAAPKSARKGAAITSLEDFDNFDPECNFELMDNVIPIAPLKNGHRPAIDLEEDDQVAGGLDTDESTYAITRRQLDLTTANVTNLSLGGLSTSRRIDQTNKSMLDDRTKCFQSRNFATQSTATRMEKLMRDLLLKGSSSGSGVQLRLTQGGCDIDAQGILVMPGANVLEFDHFLNVMDKEECHGFGSTRSHTNPTPKPQQPEPMECSPPRNSPLAYNDEMDDGDDAGPGFAFAGDSPMRQDYVSENTISKSPSNNPPPLKPEPDPPIKKNDPWMLLDALDSGGTKPRPLKKGRTIRLPLGIPEKPSLCVTGASTRDDKKAKAAASRARKALKDHQERIQQEHIWRTIGGYTTHVLDIILDEDGKIQLQPLMYHQFSNSSQRDAHLQLMTNTLLSLKGLAYGKEFAYIAKATAERRNQEKRKERLKRAQESVANPQPPAQTHAYHDDYDEDDNDEGGFGYAGVDDNNDEHNDDFDQADNEDFATASYNKPIHTQDVNDYQTEKDAGELSNTFYCFFSLEFLILFVHYDMICVSLCIRLVLVGSANFSRFVSSSHFKVCQGC